MNLQKLKEIQLEQRKLKMKASKEEKVWFTIQIATLTTLIGEVEFDQRKTDKPIDCFAKIRKYISLANGNKALTKEPEKATAFAIETSFLESLLPKQMSNADITMIIATNIAAGTFKNIGNVMSTFKKEYAGLYSNADVSRIARELFQNL